MKITSSRAFSDHQKQGEHYDHFGNAAKNLTLFQNCISSPVQLGHWIAVTSVCTPTIQPLIRDETRFWNILEHEKNFFFFFFVSFSS